MSSLGKHSVLILPFFFLFTVVHQSLHFLIDQVFPCWVSDLSYWIVLGLTLTLTPPPGLERGLKNSKKENKLGKTREI